jgi:hypothetical protein
MARPTRLTDETIDRFLQAIRGGAFPEVAARYAGFSPRAMYRYLRGSSPAHAAFRDRVVLARIELEVRLGGTVVQAGYGDPRWALAYLERHFPERWARRSTSLDDPAEPPSVNRPSAGEMIELDPNLLDGLVAKLLETGDRLRAEGSAGGDVPRRANGGSSRRASNRRPRRC